MTISLGAIDFTIKSGAVIPLLVMLPNILWMILPKEETSPTAPVPLWLNILENIGRVGILVVPFFYALDFHQPYILPVLVGMGLALGIYYACWLNYFTHGRKPSCCAHPSWASPCRWRWRRWSFCCSRPT